MTKQKLLLLSACDSFLTQFFDHAIAEFCSGDFLETVFMFSFEEPDVPSQQPAAALRAAKTTYASKNEQTPEKWEEMTPLPSVTGIWSYLEIFLHSFRSMLDYLWTLYDKDQDEGIQQYL